MTESEWLACEDPQKMLGFLRGKASDRKLRLLACGCCRRIWHLLTDERSGEAIAIAEQYADKEVSEQEMDRAAVQASYAVETVNTSAARAAKWAAVHTPYPLCGVLKTALVRNLRGYVLREPAILVDAVQTAIIREIFGNPFGRSPPLSSAVLAWNDAMVVRLAQAAYEERHLPAGALDNSRLAILADALEEAGCTSVDILGHLRGPGPHVRGCWAVDLCLGKS